MANQVILNSKEKSDKDKKLFSTSLLPQHIYYAAWLFLLLFIGILLSNLAGIIFQRISKDRLEIHKLQVEYAKEIKNSNRYDYFSVETDTERSKDAIGTVRVVVEE